MESQESLNIVYRSIILLYPELVLTAGIVLLILLSLFKNLPAYTSLLLVSLVLLLSATVSLTESDKSGVLFDGMLRKESFSFTLKILIDVAGIFACLMCLGNKKSFRLSEFSVMVLAVILGGHLLVMSHHLLMIFLSIELISISSYVLAGINDNRPASEGSLKYFLFGAVASSLMLYGFSLLYGLTGSLDFSSEIFARHVIESLSPLMMVAGILALSGFLFKISAAPMHLWAPDVYESAPFPVIAFLSVAPKIAGLGVLAKFILAMNVYGQSAIDWQAILCVLAMVTLAIGNFGALAQKNAKRMMAYSSIAQSGFLMIGIVAFLPQGLHFMLFYATVYILMNYLVFTCLQYFDSRGIKSISEYAGIGKQVFVPSLLLLVGLIALTGLPPTSGFTAKLFIFSSLWESYEYSGKSILLWLLVFGLLNTVISLFFYLKIPYFAFLKNGETAEKHNFLTVQNLLSIILVLVIVLLFFIPGLLMGWINKVNFVF